MRKLLRLLALVLVVAALGVWLATGMNRGWTKTTKPNGTVDEVTGLVDQTPVKAFQPGVDFLGAAIVGAVILTGLSFFLRNQNKQPIN